MTTTLVIIYRSTLGWNSTNMIVFSFEKVSTGNGVE